MLGSLALGLVGLNLYAAILVLARGLCFRTRIYRPMLLNIALSLAPGALILVMAVVVSVAAQTGAAALLLIPLALVWLLLLPNAGYLVTELNMSHRTEGTRVPMWFDIVLVVTLAMSGVVNTLGSTFVAHLLYATSRHGDTAQSLLRPDSLAVAGAILLLVAFGVFIGRHVRVNSWDVLRPWRLARALARGLMPQLGSAVAFTILYGVFLALMYTIVLGPVIEGLAELGR